MSRAKQSVPIETTYLPSVEAIPLDQFPIDIQNAIKFAAAHGREILLSFNEEEDTVSLYTVHQDDVSL